MPPSLTDPADLVRRWRLPQAALPDVAEASARFPLKVSDHLAERLAGLPVDDPRVRQFLPSADELVEREGFVSDPVGDAKVQRAPGLLQKYRGRALVIATAACPVHCRYCFRREYPYADASAVNHWPEVLDALRGDPGIHEVILSGGDPLSLSNAVLSRMVRELEAIPHLTRLRIHTRFPTTSPGRVDEELAALLSSTRFAPAVVVLHVNHATELDPEVSLAVRRLRATGAVLLSQSVLLRGVNDSEDALAALSEALGALGVVPYYLHLLDRVRGAGHFEVPEAEAVALVRALADRLPGYLVPKLVRELSGERAKTLVPLVAPSPTGATE
ncbi:MAG: EF-P beta-lysylation protein EpmB [Deltaproteobacteria bacterium]|nr:EF-P beta-lysylation protein EpmB [Deltaproteobacteria bacterium]